MSELSDIIQALPLMTMGIGPCIMVGYSLVMALATIDPKTFGIKDRKSVVPYFLKSAWYVDLADHIRLDDNQFKQKYPSIAKYSS